MHLVGSLLLRIGSTFALHHLYHAYLFSKWLCWLIFYRLSWDMSYWFYYLLYLTFLICLKYFRKDDWNLAWIDWLKMIISECIRINQFVLWFLFIHAGDYSTMLRDMIIKQTHFYFQLSSSNLSFSEKGKSQDMLLTISNTFLPIHYYELDNFCIDICMENSWLYAGSDDYA